MLNFTFHIWLKPFGTWTHQSLQYRDRSYMASSIISTSFILFTYSVSVKINNSTVSQGAQCTAIWENINKASSPMRQHIRSIRKHAVRTAKYWFVSASVFLYLLFSLFAGVFCILLCCLYSQVVSVFWLFSVVLLCFIYVVKLVNVFMGVSLQQYNLQMCVWVVYPCVNAYWESAACVKGCHGDTTFFLYIRKSAYTHTDWETISRPSTLHIATIILR